MQKSYDTSNTSLRLDFTTSTSGSNVTISATATQTASMAHGRYYYDIEWTHDTVEVERIAEGIITLSWSNLIITFAEWIRFRKVYD